MDLLEILKENKEENIKKYLLQYGKSPKPIAPFYFVMNKEDHSNVRNTVNERSDDTDSGSNCEAEITE